MHIEKELAVAQELARKAGDFALQYRKGEIEIENKADESPVTVADKEGEKIIVAGLQESFPEDGLLGEEGAVKDTANHRKWIIDPIDGTRDFIRNTRAWSVLIGLEENGRLCRRRCLLSGDRRDVLRFERRRRVVQRRAS